MDNTNVYIFTVLPHVIFLSLTLFLYGMAELFTD